MWSKFYNCHNYYSSTILWRKIHLRFSFSLMIYRQFLLHQGLHDHQNLCRLFVCLFFSCVSLTLYSKGASPYVTRSPSTTASILQIHAPKTNTQNCFWPVIKLKAISHTQTNIASSQLLHTFIASLSFSPSQWCLHWKQTLVNLK